MKVLILGAGLIGRAIAIDLARDPQLEVSVIDRDTETLAALHSKDARIGTAQEDLADPKLVTRLSSRYDLVLNALPGFMGFATLKAIIEAGKHVVDIAFCPENPFDLDDLAKQRGVTALVDFGVAPGMSNLLVGHVSSLLDQTDSVLIYVGGLPQVREWPYEYKAVFSPIDVIAEYTRPARFVQNGALVVREALSEPELIDFPGIGTLEAFNSDGLRTLIDTIDAPNMKEKTLRYEGHIEKIAILRDLGLFSEEEVEVGGARIRPIDLTAKLLFPKWQLSKGEADITVMQVVVTGRRGKERLRYVYNLLDRYDPATETHSMARTTGYAASMAVRLLAEGRYEQVGISPPEFVGREEACVEFLLAGLTERGVRYEERTEALGPGPEETA